MVSSSHIAVGSRHWAPQKEKSFVRAVVDSVFDDGRVRMRVEKRGLADDFLECHGSALLSCPGVSAGVANMDELAELNMAEVLENVDALYKRTPAAIYSSVGPVLIAMNPFVDLPLYGDEWTRAFRNAGQRGDIENAWQTLGPHCYWTVERAFQGLRTERHQSVVICGESGAGKTVTNRKMLEYLLDANTKRQTNSGGGNSHQKLVISEANDLLEAFGNAKTLRNDNSSRFGKYSQLRFNPETYLIEGFEIEHYLLEQSRVVGGLQGERSYHIFHYLLSSPIADELGLSGGPSEAALTKNGASVKRADGQRFDDRGGFQDLIGKLAGAGFSANDRKMIFEAVAAVIHLGNVEFEAGQDGAFQDESAQISEASQASLQKASELLTVDCLGDALITLKTSGKASYVKNVKLATARAHRDAVAKALYSRIFDFLMRSVNAEMARRQGVMGQGHESATIGLLDIFGFEDMPVNGLEQLFINLTNERIQYLFNQVMFERELDAYKREGIEPSFEQPSSNWPCIDLFTSKSPVGIIGLLADQCKVRAADPDTAFLRNLNEQMGHHSHFSSIEAKSMKPLMQSKKAKWGQLAAPMQYHECFQIHHYAGDVVYAVRDFAEKSKDVLPAHLEDVLRSCGNPCVVNSACEKNQKSLGEKFVSQLQKLADKLDSGNNFFVRCIKPNPDNIPGVTDRPFVLEQLVNGGVVAALEMRKAGYPDRLGYDDFCDEFGLLGVGDNQKRAPKARCADLLHQLIGESTQFAFGRTKIFLRAGVIERLRSALALKRSRSAIVVQRRWRWMKGLQFIHVIVQAKRSLDQLMAFAAGLGLSGSKPVLNVLEDTAVVQRVLAYSSECELSIADMPELTKADQKLKAFLQQIEECKARAEQCLVNTLMDKEEEAAALLGQLSVVEAGLGASTGVMSPADESEHRTEELFLACHEACGRARAMVEEIIHRDLPLLRENGPESFHLLGSGLPEDAAPRATMLLQRASEFVQDVKQNWEIFKAARFVFDGRASGVHSQCMDAKQKLSSLCDIVAISTEQVDDASAFAAASLQEAQRLEDDVADLFRAGSDIGAFERSAEAFLEAASAAEAAVWRVQHEREEKVREEERIRKESFERGLFQLRDYAQLKSIGGALLNVAQGIEEELDAGFAACCGAEEDYIRERILQLRQTMSDLNVSVANAPEVSWIDGLDCSPNFERSSSDIGAQSSSAAADGFVQRIRRERDSGRAPKPDAHIGSRNCGFRRTMSRFGCVPLKMLERKIKVRHRSMGEVSQRFFPRFGDD